MCCCFFFFKSSKELILVVRSGKNQNSGYPKWLTLCGSMLIMGVTSILSPDRMTKLRNFTKEEIIFLLQLMLEQA